VPELRTPRDCAQEPIHVPGSIQPHGALYVISSRSGRILQRAVGDRSLSALPGAEAWECVEALTAGLGLAPEIIERIPPAGAVHLTLVRLAPDAVYHLVGHRVDDLVVLELERAADNDPASLDIVYPHIRGFLEKLEQTRSLSEALGVAVDEVQRLTGLDRVLVYRFDETWNGEVVAERTNARLPSYLGLHFPDTDIPAQARDLYTRNRLRLIVDAGYTPAQIRPAVNPETGRPIDLTTSVLRSVSPVHLAYMRNMGTKASMSISILRGGTLWGLISCHHRDPVRVPYHVRTACDFIGQVLSMQITAKEASARMERRHALRAVQSRLLARMAAADNYVNGLIASPDDLMSLADAHGAAVVTPNHIEALGENPGTGAIRRIVDWLGQQKREDLFVTDQLSRLMPGAGAVTENASGLLAISISQIHDSFVLWFRPEYRRTITWGGDPRKPSGTLGGGLNPRTSFEAWAEIVRDRARGWEQPEIEAAAELRTAIVDIVLRKAEETAALSERLSSINKELEAFSYSVSHDLRAPFRHIVGYAELLKKHEGDRLGERGNRYIATIVESAISAGRLVDDLLSFSQMGRATIRPVHVEMNQLVTAVRHALEVEGGRKIDWRIGPLPAVRGDPGMLRLALQNLLDNAMKFTRDTPEPVISVTCRRDGEDAIFTVADNGIGFDMPYVGKLFGVFQRLHRAEDYEGTGIGLANVKRIIERHGGRVWAEGQLNRGASFHFALRISAEE
jgi:chemotaxis family two-component system sensor kinase Cph1